MLVLTNILMRPQNFYFKLFTASLILFVTIGCSLPRSASRTKISDDLKKTTGFDIRKTGKAGETELPPNVDALNGISEDEAVSIALWNNAQFQAELVAIKLAQADVLDASMVSNPVLRYLAPSGAVMASGYINFAFDFLFQRPKRIAAAQTEASRVSETLVQKGYTLIREVQTAYTDLILSKQRMGILSENAIIRTELALLANSRLRNGDISELEVSTFRADSATAIDDLVRAGLDTLIKKNTLNVLMGFSPDTSIVLEPIAFYTGTQRILQADYIELAYSYQPDMRAAQINIEAIGNRLGWERSRVLAFTGTLNFQHLNNNGGSKWLPNAFNPGIQLDLPVLNRNQGKIAKARAELEQAAFQYVAARQRIALDLANAYDRYEQSWRSFQVWNTGTLPALEEAVLLSQSSYKRGDISYIPVLEAMSRLVNGKLRRVELEADIRRSVSGLNYFIGNKWNTNQ
jgi:cobalt-zinc-cadmium efflux system outer membrane protein